MAFVAIQLHRLNDRAARFRIRRERLGAFLKEAESLAGLIRTSGTDPSAAKVDDWVLRTEAFLQTEMDSSYVARFHNFSGLTFYSDGSAAAALRNRIEGGSRRLHEFIAEFSD